MNILINLGRLLMLFVWAFLLLNLFSPFPKPLNIFVNVALFFTVSMDAIHATMMKKTLPKDGPQMTRFEEFRIFVFGVFELLIWLKKLKAKK